MADLSFKSEDLTSPSARKRNMDDRCLLDHFSEIVALHPNQPAIVQDDTSFTYQQLDQSSSQIANYLSTIGVSPGSKVGIALPRSYGFIASLLAIIKTGGCYVPIDQEAPKRRLDSMLASTDLQLIIGETFDTEVPALTWAELEHASTSYETRYSTQRTLEFANYVMFTSGSTGEPKGVVVADRGIVGLAIDTNYIDITVTDVVAFHSPVAFDASTFEIWVPLLNGATIAISERPIVKPNDVRRLVEQCKVSVLWLTAAVFHNICARDIDALAGLRSLLAGGDVLSPTAVNSYLTQSWSGSFTNGYGPTEATTFSLCAVLDDQLPDQRVPIGLPLTYGQCYIIGKTSTQLPITEAGELCVSGSGVSLGYVGQPRATAEKFVPNPYGEPGARMYRTGDTAVLNEHGVFEFHGRQDRQVKLRGHRIELSEIEHKLRLLDEIDDAYVVLEEKDDRKQIIAYVTPPTSDSMLKASLSADLPQYMVPSRFVHMSEFPLNANGKVDRSALVESLATNERNVEPPVTATEQAIADIWSEVLSTAVGRYDDYFELGGDSITCLEISGRCEESGVDIDASDILACSVLADLAKLADERALKSEVTPSSKYMGSTTEFDHDIEDSYPMSQAQLGMVFHSQQADSHGVYHDFVLHTLAMEFNEDKLFDAVEHLTESHPALRTSFDLSNAIKPMQRVHRDVFTDFDVIDCRHLCSTAQDQEIERWIASEQERGFDLTQPDLFRVVAVRVSESIFVLGLSFHHAILDGWSTAVWIDSLCTTYQCKLSGREFNIENCGTSYKQFIAEEEMALLRTEDIDFWKENATKITPTLPPLELLVANSEKKKFPQSQLLQRTVTA